LKILIKGKEKTMANKRNWYGILVTVLAFGMAVIGCSNGNGTTNKGPTNNSDTGFTLNNIPEGYEERYAFLWAENGDYHIYGYQSIDLPTKIFTGIQIKNGKVNLPIWIATLDHEGYPVSFSKYSGNDNIEYVEVYIINSATIKIGDVPIDMMLEFETTKFTNGNATKSWNEGIEYP
jgi:hypothetical protein